jgi:hypothetical protein
MRFQLVLGLGLSCGLSGCVSGQTGSPECAAAVSCVCDPVSGGGTLLRVRVEQGTAGKLAAVVEEVFAPPRDAHNVQVGERVGGAVLDEQPCASEAGSGLQVGSELLVLYDAGVGPNHLNCSTFQDCVGAECASLTEPGLSDCWMVCDSKTSAACGQQRAAALLDGAFSWAIPWGDTLSFGASRPLASSEISVLFSYGSCIERFPAPPARPCDDTPSAGACSAAPRASAPGGGGWALLLGLLLARRLRRATAPARQSGANATVKSS